MRSCASGVARPKKGAKVRNVEASKKEPQPRKRQRARIRAARRSVEPCRAGRAGAHPYRRRRRNSWSYHFSDAYQWRPFCQFFLERFLDRSGVTTRNQDGNQKGGTKKGGTGQKAGHGIDRQKTGTRVAGKSRRVDEAVRAAGRPALSDLSLFLSLFLFSSKPSQRFALTCIAHDGLLC